MARPLLPWRSPLAVLPVDGKQVYVRRLPFYDVPTLATYSAGDVGFALQVPAGGLSESQDVLLYAVQVHTWKYRLLADEQAQFPP